MLLFDSVVTVTNVTEASTEKGTSYRSVTARPLDGRNIKFNLFDDTIPCVIGGTYVVLFDSYYNSDKKTSNLNVVNLWDTYGRVFDVKSIVRSAFIEVS